MFNRAAYLERAHGFFFTLLSLSLEKKRRVLCKAWWQFAKLKISAFLHPSQQQKQQMEKYLGARADTTTSVSLQQMLECVDEARAASGGEHAEALDDLEKTLKSLEPRQLPVVSPSGLHPAVQLSFEVITFFDQGKARANCVMRLTLPDGESRVEWMPWLPYQTQPAPRPLTALRKVKIFNKLQTEPRHVRTYGKSYKYGKDAGVACEEGETPADVGKMMATINAAYGLEGAAQVNMCLQNDYPTGRHCIGQHSDNEKQIAQNKSVFCFVTGEASRTIAFRAKKTRILKIDIPAGLYAMVGQDFQSLYTHEIPQAQIALFNRLVDKAKELLGEEFEAMSAAEKATLLKARDVGSQVFAGNQRYLAAYKKWALGRSSYTFRNFAAAATAKRKRSV